MSTSNASVRPQGKRKPVTDAELPAELKHFYNQYAKTFLTQRSGAARTASTAASQGETALLAMDFLVRPLGPYHLCGDMEAKYGEAARLRAAKLLRGAGFEPPPPGRPGQLDP